MSTRIQIPIVGPSYKQRSQDLNNQVCKNLYPVLDGKEGRNRGALYSCPGFLSTGEVADADQVRGLFVADNQLLAVIDNKLYQVTFNTTTLVSSFTERGTLSTSTGYVDFAANNANEVIIVDGTSGYIYETDTNAFNEIADTDFPDGAATVAHIDGYFVVEFGSRMFHSGILDGATWDALDQATAESKPDGMVAVFTHKNQLYAFGEKSVEVWYNAANSTGFAFTRYQNAIIEQGCGAKGSIAVLNGQVVWLDDRGYVVVNQNYVATIISDDAISNAIQNYTTTSDAKAFVYSEDGHEFYVLTFPTEKKCWVFDAITGAWHERTSMISNADWRERQYIANCHAKYNGYNLIGSAHDGKIHIMSTNYYDENGTYINRERVTQYSQQHFDLVSVSSLELKVEEGTTSLLTGQGSDPQIMMQYSHDGGYTWSSELWRSVGKQGKYAKRVKWNRLGSGREWLFKFRMTDPAPFMLIEATIESAGVDKASLETQQRGN